MKRHTSRSNTNIFASPLAFLRNILLIYIIYGACRVEYVLANWSTFAEGLLSNSLMDLLKGSLLFDTSAILYTNSLYALMMLIPLHFKERKTWRKVAKWTFIIFNAITIIANIADSLYFKYTGRRTTATVFSEFSNEDNLGSIFWEEITNHIFIVLFGIVLICSLYFLYKKPKGNGKLYGAKDFISYYATHIICLLLFVPLCIAGMRGGFTHAVRPITISNANQYVNKPSEGAVILNTPFSIIRTLGKKTFVNPEYYSSEELNRIYSPLHTPADSAVVRKKNVVVLIVESFGREYIGKYNETLEGGKYKGYTPFIDSLYSQSLSFDYTFCNGRKSIDGMPSILSSIPMFVEPFFLTSASMNEVSGIAGELSKAGYYTAFFHGAENGSMGFQAFARTTGFKDYFGRTEYNEDKRFNGDKDFDGMWAIWDEPFLQFYGMKMSEMKEPFMTAVFTASSHHPYAIPEKYKDVYPEEGNNVIHKCIRYTDMALRKFFEYASKQQWYKNTIFVFTSDHTNLSDHAEYQTDLGGFGSPILFFDPSGEIKAERRHCIAQQIDIMPTVLNYLGYKKPYVSFGIDLFNTKDADTWAVNYINGIYQYVKGDYLLQFNGEEVKAFYNIKKDWLLTKNLSSKNMPEMTDMEHELKAIIQSYMERMLNDNLTAK